MKNHLDNDNMLLALPMKTDTLSFNHIAQESREKLTFLEEHFTPKPAEIGLFNLKQINCFIGTNNAGKSRFIRTIFQLLEVSCTIPDYTLNTNPDYDIASINEYEIKEKEELSKIKSLWGEIYDNEKADEVFEILRIYNKYKHIYPEKKARHFESWTNQLKRAVVNYYTPKLGRFRQKRLYIPILRGARLLEGHADPYAERTSKDYHLRPDQMFTGLSIYQELQRHLLGNYEQRELVKQFETFLSQQFFNGNHVSLIPKMGKDVVYIRIGEQELEIHNLGDGIQALIVILFPLFLRRKGDETWAIFIEEPEAHLHPKWQRFLLDTFEQEFPNFQFFITTHSSIFISHNPDVSLFRLSKPIPQNKPKPQDKPKILVEHIDSEKISCLKELGYAPSDLLQSNYIIWVEGPSDIPYIKFFIENLQDPTQPPLIEGQDYSIMVYGGGIIHSLDEITPLGELIPNINPNFTLILDSDKEFKNNQVLDKKEDDYLKLIPKLGQENIWRTQKREIENYIPLEIFKEAIRQASQYAPTTTINFADPNPDFGDRMKFTIDNDGQLHSKGIKFNKNELKNFGFDFSSTQGFTNWDPAKTEDFIDMVEAKLTESLSSSGNKLKIANKATQIWQSQLTQHPIDPEIKTEIQKIISQIHTTKN